MHYPLGYISRFSTPLSIITLFNGLSHTPPLTLCSWWFFVVIVLSPLEVVVLVRLMDVPVDHQILLLVRARWVMNAD